ncbi:MAG: RND family transporter [Epsilonproteobacteria bacterium]|nr:MAG: RND family transporter [Campylobacterota bacterium]
MIDRFYSSVILRYPKIVLLLVLLAVGYLGINSSKLEIDASSETLLLENDKDLQFTRLINERYQTPDFLVIAYTPKHDLLSSESLESIRHLSSELIHLDRVESVTSILNVPLMQSPPKPVKEMLQNIPTLESPDINLSLAKNELLNSPIYSENIVSKDFKTTALMVNLYTDEKYYRLLKTRNTLMQKAKEHALSNDEKEKLKQTVKMFKAHRDTLRAIDHQTIIDIRAIMDRYRNSGTLFLGGVSMIADDMITFVKRDLKTYGTIVLGLIILLLWLVFRQLRWVLIPVLIAILSLLATIGLLGLLGLEITVISSNFISLQLIITMSIIIHLIVQYREFSLKQPKATQQELVLQTIQAKIAPTFFAIITTIAGFSSLVFSGIVPVTNLGWMMSAGISISLLIAFLVFPSMMMLLKRCQINTSFERRYSLTAMLGDIVEKRSNAILLVSFFLIVFSLSGASKLIVENSFIDYFKPSTEIYQGMAVIDQKLGGTTPLDVIIDFPLETKVEIPDEADDEFDEFEAEFEASENEAQYWFTTDKMRQVQQVHTYLEGRPEVGKVLSLGTMLALGRTLNDGKDLDDFQLALIYNELPKAFRKIILDPYVSIDNNQVRFALRIIDSNPELRRDHLLKQIEHDLVNMKELDKDRVHLSNLIVLYNNMLQSLFGSQIMTLGLMAAILTLMFLFLYRSLKLALIAMTVNLIPIGVILGLMGWAAIPLDMMTITIAAISIGIAVDDTIHYIHRYTEEYYKDYDYIAAMHRSHNSIGYALYYTSAIIIIGFFILIFSAFIPTIYFGLLTVLAMLMALSADLILLPKLILLIKPFSKKG